MSTRARARKVLSVFLCIVMAVTLQAPLASMAFAQGTIGGDETQVNSAGGAPENPSPGGGPKALTIPEDSRNTDATAEPTELITELVEEEPETVIPDESVPEPDELLNDYIEVLTAEVAESYDAVSAEAMNNVIASNTRGSRLTGAEKNAYDLLRAAIAKVAAGDSRATSTAFKFTFDELFPAEVMAAKYTATDLGVASIVEGDSITQAAKDAVVERYSLNTDAILNALLYDCPYELYWFDKTAGMAGRAESTISATKSNDEWQTYCTGESAYTFYFAVSRDYTPSSYYVYDFGGVQKPIQTDRAKASSIQKAIKYAARIVEEASKATSSDIGKLAYYKDLICNDVSYNEAAAKNESTPYGDPWQLVYAFDQNPQTNIVCEGYSKAFKYLCDLTSFEDPTLDCYTVSGVMAGGTGAGRHMWNLVSIDGNNYLVDVTNCDSGTIGSPNKLFMKGNANKTTTRVTEKVNGTNKSFDSECYTFGLSNNVSYTYDYSTVNIYAENERLLASSDYSTASGTTDISQASITGIGNKTYNGQAQKPSPTVSISANGASVTLRPGVDYAVIYRNNTNAGTATAIIAGKGSYAGAKPVTFKISPASLAKASVTGIANKTYNGKAQSQKPVVKLAIGGKTVTLKAGTDYTISYLNAKKKAISASSVKASGTYYVKITGKGNFTGVAQKAFKVNKAKQPMVAKAVTKTASAKNLKSKAQVVAKGITVTKAQGKITYAKVAKGSAKCLSINKTTGKITVAKGTKAGAYKIKVNVTAAGNANYAKGSKTVTVTVKVK